jgi:4-amino-4-deoxy-L-arabinose transferase-like glycosyltransferase
MRNAELHSAFRILHSAISLPLIVLLVLCSFLFFYRLADRDLWSSHEARAAQDAQAILLDGQWGLPRLFDRQVELQKPPLYYWLVAALAKLNGEQVNVWCVRLPAAFAGLGGVLLVYTLARRCNRGMAGMLAAGTLATALHYTWLARIGRIDMPLTFAIGLSLGGFYLGQRCRHEQTGHGAWRWFLLAYLAVAGAVLLKGPIGAVLPLAVAGVFLLVEGELPAPWRIRAWLRLTHEFGLWWGLPLVMGIALPWYVWANIHTDGQLFQVFFWKHNIERGLGGGTLSARPWWFYGPQLAFDLLPWSLLLPILLRQLIRQGWWREDAEARFGLIWLLTMTFVLSCSRFKRADYLLPAYPGAALFLGSVAERWYRGVSCQRLFAIGFGLLLGVVTLGWGIYLTWIRPEQGPGKEYRLFAEEIRKRAPAPQLILFFRTEAHTLAFHVGQPIDTLREWENLDVWVGRPEIYHVVMPLEYAREWSRYLKSGRLEEVMHSTILAGASHNDPLVLLRTRPGAAPYDP